MHPAYNPDYWRAYDPGAWTTFFSAETSASAALVGLLFVAISINLTKIVALRQLVARAAKTLCALSGILLACTMCLAPGQPLVVLGVGLTAVGVLVWAGTTFAQHRSSHGNEFVTRFQAIFQQVITQCSALPMVAAGISLIVGRGGGLYWLLVCAVFSIVSALMDAWVLLIEILR